jgi:hypothetical protein
MNGACCDTAASPATPASSSGTRHEGAAAHRSRAQDGFAEEAVLGFRALKLKANRRLVGRAKRFSVRFYVTAVDAAGNRAQTTRTVKVRPR